ncbi:contact-dependent growth inhibition system immunity protein [Amycolatopsis nalaikhensis]|uniref:Contact-dependent growth inhibition system immunity protein n=1 Tax=Amycolatopsis nalaikhensis TaxID=715472 RepID=A0ABY8XZ85_9PSEU|nr:contact-dependent growth inhibition system immunity protein [Amycolatopsis sp. 2-2]WIV60918.1 contact-dependent growth inhibition system immunity protein [Amycolatopsis sp. 2-2]
MYVESWTLEQLDGHVWGDPPDGASRLVKTVHELRRKPVGQLDAEDLRLLLGQQTGVDALVPYALDVLEANPLAEGDYYPGDLLVAVLGLSGEFWRRHAAHAARLTRIVTVASGMDLDAHHAPADVIAAGIAEYRARRG